MSYTIPNDSDPAYLDTEFQSQLFAADLDILQAAIGGVNGVVGGGCLVSESDTPAMSVKVLGGSIASDSVLITVSAGTVLIADADATDPRFDLIVALDDGSVDVFTGTPDPSPLLPTIGAGFVALAAVYVPVGTTSIIDANIVDKRVAVGDPTMPTAGWITVEATLDRTRNNVGNLTVDEDLHFAMAPNTKYRIRGRLFFNRVGGAAANNAVKVGIGGPASPTLLVGSVSVPISSIQPNYFGSGLGYRVGYGFSIYNTTTGFTTAVGAWPSLSITGYSHDLTIDAVVHNGANSGDFAPWWCMSTAQAYDMFRLAGSYLEYETV